MHTIIAKTSQFLLFLRGKRPLRRKISNIGFNTIHVLFNSCVCPKFGEYWRREVTETIPVHGIPDREKE